ARRIPRLLHVPCGVDHVSITQAGLSGWAHETVGSAAKAQIFLAAPVAEVVPRFVTRERIVGDLVVTKAAGFEGLVDGEEGCRLPRVVGERQATAPGELAEAGARLDGELVTGEVLQPQVRQRPRLVARVLRRLLGEPEDEIRGHPRNPCRERPFDRASRA